MQNSSLLQLAVPLMLTRRGFTAAAVLSVLVPPMSGLAQTRPPAFT